MLPTRHVSLDALRGFAVMGILLMNIVAFAFPMSAYVNPMAAGYHGSGDLAAWATTFIFVDGKMRGIFSVLFGASLLLVLDQATQNGRNAAQIHVRRMAWLLLFGLLHYWFIWDGDILALYALCGFVAYGLRDLPVKTLARIGVLLIIANMLLWALIMATAHGLRAEAEGGGSGAIAAYRDMADALGDPLGASIAADLRLFQGSYASIVAHRLADHISGPIQLAVAYGLETLGLMAWGMALFKSGALTGLWHRRRLRHWAMGAYALGLPLSALLAYAAWQSGFDVLITADIHYVLDTPMRMAVMIGHLMLLLWIVTQPVLGGFLMRVAAAGRMAFSNYIMTSILMTSVFYGYGLGLFGTLSRAQIYLVVPGVWALMLLWSPLWLRVFRYGPLEWVWRSLVFGQRQPMRITPD